MGRKKETERHHKDLQKGADLSGPVRPDEVVVVKQGSHQDRSRNQDQIPANRKDGKPRGQLAQAGYPNGAK